MDCRGCGSRGAGAFIYFFLFLFDPAYTPSSGLYQIFYQIAGRIINKAQKSELGKLSSAGVAEGRRWRNQRSALKKAE